MRLAILSALNGISLAALYFIVASGFNLIFGLMRTVNLAHGSLYLLGGYIGYQAGAWMGSWYFAVLGGALAAALCGVLLQVIFLDRVQGQDLRQALITIGISIVVADLLLAQFGGITYQFEPPAYLQESIQLPLVGSYPVFRLLLLAFAAGTSFVLWFGLNKTKIGRAIKAGVDDRDMLAALGMNPSRLFIFVAAVGAALAGLAGVIGGTALSISPGEDSRYLLVSLVVTIVGGMGSLAGAAIGALLVGLIEQVGLAYFPNYSIALTYVLMVAVLAICPQGIFGRPA